MKNNLMANSLCKSQGWYVCDDLAYKAVLLGKVFSPSLQKADWEIDQAH